MVVEGHKVLLDQGVRKPHLRRLQKRIRPHLRRPPPRRQTDELLRDPRGKQLRVAVEPQEAEAPYLRRTRLRHRFRASEQLQRAAACRAPQPILRPQHFASLPSTALRSFQCPTSCLWTSGPATSPPQSGVAPRPPCRPTLSVQPNGRKDPAASGTPALQLPCAGIHETTTPTPSAIRRESCTDRGRQRGHPMRRRLAFRVRHPTLLVMVFQTWFEANRCSRENPMEVVPHPAHADR